MTNPIRHIAGPHEDGVQQCTRCLKIIHDKRDESRSSGWPAGRIIIEDCLGWRIDMLQSPEAIDCLPMEAGL